MNENKLSKIQLVGYIALYVLVAFFTCITIYLLVNICPGLTYLDKELFPLIVVMLVVFIAVWLAGISSLVFHCVKTMKKDRKFLIFHTAVETSSVFFVFAATHFITVISGWGLGGLWGRNDSAAVAFHIFCFVLFFITAIISLTLLYLNTIYKKQMNRKLMMVNYIGLAVTVVLSLIIFIPDFICVLIVSY